MSSDNEEIEPAEPRSTWFWFDEQNKCIRTRIITIPRPGIILALITAISFTSGGTLVKNVVHSLGPGEVVAVRYVIMGLVMAIPIMFNPKSVKLTRKQWIIAIIGGSLGGATTVIAYTTYRYIPLMDAQTLFNFQSIFVPILAAIFLREQIGIIDIVAIIIALNGIVLVCQPSFIFGSVIKATNPTFRLLGAGLGLLSALCLGIIGIICRYIKDIKCYVFTFLLSFSGILFSLIMALAIDRHMPLPNLSEFGQLIAIGFLACISKCSLTLAYQYEDATPVTMVQSLEIVFSYFFQWFFFNHRPKYLETIGAALVITGIIIIILKQKIKEKLTCCKAKSQKRHQRLTFNTALENIDA